ncbi:AAA-ATPase [Actinidia chinensis var. chinensis]|uniref:AAA-ATPase n=1 Tax=Actinidia chinensis var. chinensis TaxID=1590841 RepID=A0A2R6Q997_ACTCC|nr:AAA-ATPase [Actinidia chinensis var. chinensis]
MIFSILKNSPFSNFTSFRNFAIMFPVNPILLLGLLVVSYLVLRFLYKSSALHIIKKWWRVIEDRCHVHQFYKVPQFNEHMQENQLYRKVSVYLNSLASGEDSDFANLFSGNKSNEINVVFDPDQTVIDTFLSARVRWTNEKGVSDGSRALVLKIRRNDKRRILRPYLQHIHTVFDEIEQRRKEVKLYINAETNPEKNGRWRSVPFSHPGTIDAVAMQADLKTKVKSDLESFLKSKQYYNRLGRVWKRSYLLYGPSGTGKSSFVAGMAKFLCYDVYDINLSNVVDDSDLKMLLLQTTNKSLIVIEDLDRYLAEKSTAVSLSGILNFMDGILSCCGEERVMVFTMNVKDQIDPSVLRPGRIDVHVHFPPCDFSAFKTLANSYLGLKEHKLFPQVEEIFQTGSSLSPAEIGEIMISNRTSPSRALKSVITALQTNAEHGRAPARVGQCLTASSSGREELGESGSFFSRENVHAMKDFRKLYGLLRLRSGRKSSMDLDSTEKENSRHEIS